jgi:hypothetical protein
MGGNTVCTRTLPDLPKQNRKVCSLFTVPSEKEKDMPKKVAKREVEFIAALERLREAESLIGTETTTMLMDNFPEHRLMWLRLTRALLRQCGIQPENLGGRWQT